MNDPQPDPPVPTVLPRPVGLLVVALVALAACVFVGRHALIWYSIATLSLAGCIISYLHATVKGLNPIARMVSEYATNPQYGEWMNGAFFLFGCGILGVGATYYQLYPGNHAFPICTLIAGGTTLLLGHFTMRVTVKGEMESSVFEGKMHGRCTAASFGLAIITMLYFAVSPPVTLAGNDWLRSVAMCHFLYAALSALLFGLLGLGQNEQIRRQGEVGAESQYNEHIASVMGRGLGLLERILIFMFLEWTLVLSFVAKMLG